ncbi:MAG: PolC-type DNA polymerase III N-terminal domain-containing protein, partial [Bacillota bacterium]
MKAHHRGREAYASLLAHVAIDDHLRQTLDGGELLRLEVWRKKRLWRIHVRFDRLLPPDVYR